MDTPQTSAFTATSKHIFISHCSEDEYAVDAVYSFLNNHGITCWLAKKHIVGSDEYGRSINEAIKNSKILLVIFSEDANHSEFVRMEVEHAISNKIKVIVFRIDKTSPTGKLKMLISSLHWIDAFEGSLEVGIEKLYFDCANILQITPQNFAQGKRRIFLNPFFFTGRIRRLEFILSIIIFWSGWIGLGAIIGINHYDVDQWTVNTFFALALLLILFWFIIAQGIKRCHDLSKSGWYMLDPRSLFMLPAFIGSLKKNKYGNNPRKRILDKPPRLYLNLGIVSAFLILLGLFSFKVFSTPAVKRFTIDKGFSLFETKYYYVEYPTNWFIDSSKKEDGIYRILSPIEDTADVFRENVAFAKLGLWERYYTLDKFADATERYMKREPMFKDTRLVLNTREERNGTAFQVLKFEGRMDTIHFEAEVNCCILAPAEYSFVFLSQACKANKYKDIQQKIMQSFTVKKSGY